MGEAVTGEGEWSRSTAETMARRPSGSKMRTCFWLT